jgi:hypothetical protein
MIFANISRLEQMKTKIKVAVTSAKAVVKIPPLRGALKGSGGTLNVTHSAYVRVHPRLLLTSRLRYTNRFRVVIRHSITCVSRYFIHSVCTRVCAVRYSPSPLFTLAPSVCVITSVVLSLSGLYYSCSLTYYHLLLTKHRVTAN